jgi:lipopolysaccharide biosynthesis glycosyltransferase
MKMNHDHEDKINLETCIVSIINSNRNIHNIGIYIFIIGERQQNKKMKREKSEKIAYCVFMLINLITVCK